MVLVVLQLINMGLLLYLNNKFQKYYNKISIDIENSYKYIDKQIKKIPKEITVKNVLKI